MMQTNDSTKFLRLVLCLDAVSCVVMGSGLIFGASTLESLLSISSAHLSYAGLSLLPFAMLVFYAAARNSLSPGLVWTIIVLNAVWTLDSLAILLTGQIAPNFYGGVFVVGQAFAVGSLAFLEYAGWKKARDVFNPVVF